MQISIKDKLARKVGKVLLDGKDITKRNFYVDDEAGEVHCYKINSEDRFYLDPETKEIAKEILYGKVEIIFKEESN